MHTITFDDSASNPGKLTHPGPLVDACAYFYGEIGPQWPATLDGQRGYFTAISGPPRFIATDRPGGLPGDAS